MTYTTEQIESLHKLWQRHSQGFATFYQFLKSTEGLIGGSGCVMVRWCNMWVGVENDGYTHT